MHFTCLWKCLMSLLSHFPAKLITGLIHDLTMEFPLCLFFPIFFGVEDYLMQIVPFHRLWGSKTCYAYVFRALYKSTSWLKFCPCNWNILGKHLSKRIAFCLSTLIWQPCNPIHSKLHMHHFWYTYISVHGNSNNYSYIF